jgi:N-acetylglucosamine-6-phosphate deacetylase
VRLPDGTLAGSSLTMDRAVANLIRLAGADLVGAARAAAEVPCELLGLPAPLRPGSPADVVWLDRELRPRAVLVGGEVVAGSL